MHALALPDVFRDGLFALAVAAGEDHAGTSLSKSEP